MLAWKNHHHRYGIRGSWINRAAVASEQVVGHWMGLVDRTLSRADDIEVEGLSRATSGSFASG